MLDTKKFLDAMEKRGANMRGALRTLTDRIDAAQDNGKASVLYWHGMWHSYGDACALRDALIQRVSAMPPRAACASTKVPAACAWIPPKWPERKH